jgi:hypothetical protein
MPGRPAPRTPPKAAHPPNSRSRPPTPGPRPPTPEPRPPTPEPRPPTPDPDRKLPNPDRPLPNPDRKLPNPARPLRIRTGDPGPARCRDKSTASRSCPRCRRDPGGGLMDRAGCGPPAKRDKARRSPPPWRRKHRGHAYVAGVAAGRVGGPRYAGEHRRSATRVRTRYLAVAATAPLGVRGSQAAPAAPHPADATAGGPST